MTAPLKNMKSKKYIYRYIAAVWAFVVVGQMVDAVGEHREAVTYDWSLPAAAVVFLAVTMLLGALATLEYIEEKDK